MIGSEDKFYVYVHRRADNGEIFYVGKGIGSRAWSSARNEYWHRIVKKYDYTVHVVARFSSEYCAYSLERAMVNKLGIENLTNIYPGGSYDMNGFSMPKKTREKLSSGRSGDKHWNYGKKHKPDTIKAMLCHGCDETEYDFDHIDGRKFRGSTNSLMHTFGLSKSDGSNLRAMVLKGRYSHVRGWFCYGFSRPMSCINSKGLGGMNNKKMSLTHNSGLTFFGTQHEFKKMYGIKQICLLWSSKAKTVKGWMAVNG